MSKTMLIDAAHPEETRVAIVDGRQIEEFDFESRAKRQLRGNIYLAKVTRVEPSLQAAFIEYGGNRHGFLAFSEIHPDYYQIPKEDREALLREEAEREVQARSREEPRPLEMQGELGLDMVTPAVAVSATARRLATLAGLPPPPPSGATPPKRLHPARASDGPPGPALIGFARPLARHLAPAMAAYHAETERLALSRPR